jgi:hypothetical protein
LFFACALSQRIKIKANAKGIRFEGVAIGDTR